MKNPLKSLSSSYFWERFLSLCISFGLTYLVISLASQSSKQEFYTHALLRVYLPSRLTTIGPEEYSVRVKLSLNHELALFWQDPSYLRGNVYLFHLEEAGQVQVRLTRELFQDLPEYVEVFFPNPYLSLQVDHKVTKRVPVRVAFAEEFQPAGELRLDPSSVAVTGARSELTKLEEVHTLPLQSDFLSQKTFLRVGLDLPSLQSLEWSQKWVDLFYRP